MAQLVEGISTIGVIGAGQMGNGIAHVAAVAGYEVRLMDVSQAALEKGLATIHKNHAGLHPRHKIGNPHLQMAQGYARREQEVTLTEDTLFAHIDKGEFFAIVEHVFKLRGADRLCHGAFPG